MKIGGRIIRDSKIGVNNDNSFKATYKSHLITVDLVNRGHTNTYDVYVRKLTGLTLPCKLSEPTKRCTIHDAIIYALDKSGL